MADFPLCTDTQIKVVGKCRKAIEVHPELRFGDEAVVVCIAFDVGVLFTPEIGKTGERIFALTEVHIPCAGELEAVGRVMILQVLIESREGIATSEVAIERFVLEEWASSGANKAKEETVFS